MLKNVMRNAQLAALFVITGVASASSAVAKDYDANGCSALDPGCKNVQQHWDEDSDTVTITRVTNHCGERILIRLCNETENDGGIEWICHDYALSAGETIDQHTFSSTGRSRVNALGSLSSSGDAACRRYLPSSPR